MSLQVTFRPIETWPGAMTPRDERVARFRVGYGETLALLERELEHLGAERVVIQLALAEGDLRRDGMPRAHARPEHPGVMLSFESRHGPLRYATDLHLTWQANLRAVALALEALRAVDRYGVTRGGEQYRGWTALTAGGPSADRGRDLIRQHGSVVAALKATHPDHGGSADDFADVQAARAAGA